MKEHPFKPLVFKNTRGLVIGTLPPESATFYFSNSSNTRLWDILYSIQQNKVELSNNSNLLSKDNKIEILKSLNLGIYDIIFGYDRIDFYSTRDEDIIPLKYSDIIDLVKKTKIEKLLFVYKSAAIWFLHSLVSDKPIHHKKLKYNLEYGVFKELSINNRIIKCILLPNPLNRGKKGETLNYKLNQYKNEIL